MKQNKFVKSYSLSTNAMKVLALAAKDDGRNPSDFLDRLLLDKLAHYLPKKKAK